MATYIPGITDYIPQIQQFRPDYNFYGNILQSKQGQFDANHKQLRRAGDGRRPGWAGAWRDSRQRYQ